MQGGELAIFKKARGIMVAARDQVRHLENGRHPLKKRCFGWRTGDLHENRTDWPFLCAGARRQALTSKQQPAEQYRAANEF
jgi:hypothetical protein